MNDMNTPPEIKAEIVFLSESEGGRHSLPEFDGPPWYQQHIVIQDRTVRLAMPGTGGTNRELYLGVEFVAGPSSPEVGVSGKYRLSLTYFSVGDYSAVQPGATFTVREGRRIIAHGVVEALL